MSFFALIKDKESLDACWLIYLEENNLNPSLYFVHIATIHMSYASKINMDIKSMNFMLLVKKSILQSSP